MIKKIFTIHWLVTGDPKNDIIIGYHFNVEKQHMGSS